MTEKVAVAALNDTSAAEPSDDEDDAEAQNSEEGDSAPEAAAREEAPAQTPAQQQLALGPYHVQVGSYLDVAGAKSRLATVAEKASDLLERSRIADGPRGSAWQVLHPRPLRQLFGG